MRSRRAAGSDRRVGRPAVERERTSQRIRRWIVDAEFAAGSRLPAHHELARRMKAEFEHQVRTRQERPVPDAAKG